MSRSGYSDDLEPRDLAMWRGQVMSVIRGKKGQAFLRELLESLEAMPEKRLIRHELQQADGEVCALGALGVKRGMDNLKDIDPDDYDGIASKFGIGHQLIQEIENENDEHCYGSYTPEQRWEHMYCWVKEHIKSPSDTTPKVSVKGDEK